MPCWARARALGAATALQETSCRLLPRPRLLRRMALGLAGCLKSANCTQRRHSRCETRDRSRWTGEVHVRDPSPKLPSYGLLLETSSSALQSSSCILPVLVHVVVVLHWRVTLMTAWRRTCIDSESLPSGHAVLTGIWSCERPCSSGGSCSRPAKLAAVTSSLVCSTRTSGAFPPRKRHDRGR